MMINNERAENAIVAAFLRALYSPEDERIMKIRRIPASGRLHLAFMRTGLHCIHGAGIIY